MQMSIPEVQQYNDFRIAYAVNPQSEFAAYGLRSLIINNLNLIDLESFFKSCAAKGEIK
ncbi:hypothetical protein BH18THE1_BH18THE1_18360 [soil metagenome]